MKSLERATADYERAKERMEYSKARYDADVKKFREAEAVKTEAENLEYIRMLREMNVSVSELARWQKEHKGLLPQMMRGEMKQDDEFEKNEEQREEKESECSSLEKE